MVIPEVDKGILVNPVSFANPVYLQGFIEDDLQHIYDVKRGITGFVFDDEFESLKF